MGRTPPDLMTALGDRDRPSRLRSILRTVVTGLCLVLPVLLLAAPTRARAEKPPDRSFQDPDRGGRPDHRRDGDGRQRDRDRTRDGQGDRRSNDGDRKELDRRLQQLGAAQVGSNPFDPAKQASTTLSVTVAIKPDGILEEDREHGHDEKRGHQDEDDRTRWLLRATWQIGSPTVATVTQDVELVPPFTFVFVREHDDERRHGDDRHGGDDGQRGDDGVDGTRGSRFILKTISLPWNGRTTSGCASDGSYTSTASVQLLRVRGSRSKVKSNLAVTPPDLTVAGTAPVIRVHSPATSPALTRDPSIRVDGVVDTLLPVTLTVAGQVTPVLASGTFVANVPLPLECGNTVTLSGVDCGGRPAAPVTLTVIRVVRPPVVSLSGVDVPWITMKSPPLRADYAASCPSVGIATVKILSSGADISSFFDIGPSSATVKAGVNLNLPEGPTKIDAACTDVVGNVGAAPTLSFGVDTLAPGATIGGVLQGGFTNQKNPPLEISYSDPGAPATGSGVDTSTLQILITNGGTTRDRTASFAVGPSGATPKAGADLGLEDGSVQVQTSLRDVAGNLGAATPLTFTLDTQPPSLALSFSPQNGAFTSSARPVLTAAFQDSGSGVDLSAGIVGTLDGASVTFKTGPTSATFTPTADLSESPHELELAVTDKAGNSSGTVTLSFTPDLTAPQLALSPSSGKTLTNDRPTLSAMYVDPGTFASGIQQNSYEASLDNVSITTASSVGPLQASFTPSRALAPGAHVFRAQVADAVGHVTSSQSQFNVQPPPPPVINPGYVAGNVIDGSSGAPLADVTIVVADGGPATTDGTGRYVVPLAAGTHRLTFSKTGYAGQIDRTAIITAGRDTALEVVAFFPSDPKTTLVTAALGGVATDSTGSIQLTIPPGALSGDTTIRITKVSGTGALADGSPSSVIAGTSYIVEPEGITLLAPVTVTLPNLQQLKPNHPLLAMAFDQTTGCWQSSGGGAVSADGSHIVVQTTHFSPDTVH